MKNPQSLGSKLIHFFSFFNARAFSFDPSVFFFSSFSPSFQFCCPKFFPSHFFVLYKFFFHAFYFFIFSICKKNISTTKASNTKHFFLFLCCSVTFWYLELGVCRSDKLHHVHHHLHRHHPSNHYTPTD